MKNWIVNNFWIKVGSLMLAVITWLYVNWELDKIKVVSDARRKPLLTAPAKKEPPLEEKHMNRGYITEKD